MFNSDAVQINSNNKRQFPACEIHKALFTEAKVDDKGNFIFTFEDEEGLYYYSKKIWGNTDQVNPNGGTQEQTDLKVQRAVQVVTSLVKNISPDMKIQASSFGEYCQKIVAEATKSIAKNGPKEFYIKLTYDSTGRYPDTGYFPDWFELIQTNEAGEALPTRLKFSNWERENRMTAAVGSFEKSPVKEKSNSDDGLPF